MCDTDAASTPATETVSGDEILLRKLELCDNYAAYRTELSTSLADMYWLLTVAKRKPGGCSVTSAEDFPEEMQASVRVSLEKCENGTWRWRLVNMTKEDENGYVVNKAADRADGLRVRGHGSQPANNRDIDTSSTSTIIQAKCAAAVSLLKGALSPTMRKLVTVSAPSVLETTCTLAGTVVSILQDEHDDVIASTVVRQF